MNFYSVYVPYSKTWVAKEINQFEAYELQRTILENDRTVTWVIHNCKQEREIANKILDR